jgi:hypothetical protein
MRAMITEQNYVKLRLTKINLNSSLWGGRIENVNYG